MRHDAYALLGFMNSLISKLQIISSRQNKIGDIEGVAGNKSLSATIFENLSKEIIEQAHLWDLNDNALGFDNDFIEAFLGDDSEIEINLANPDYYRESYDYLVMVTGELLEHCLENGQSGIGVAVFDVIMRLRKSDKAEMLIFDALTTRVYDAKAHIAIRFASKLNEAHRNNLDHTDKYAGLLESYTRIMGDDKNIDSKTPVLMTAGITNDNSVDNVYLDYFSHYLSGLTLKGEGFLDALRKRALADDGLKHIFKKGVFTTSPITDDVFDRFLDNIRRINLPSNESHGLALYLLEELSLNHIDSFNGESDMDKGLRKIHSTSVFLKELLEKDKEYFIGHAPYELISIYFASSFAYKNKERIADLKPFFEYLQAFSKSGLDFYSPCLDGRSAMDIIQSNFNNDKNLISEVELAIFSQNNDLVDNAPDTDSDNIVSNFHI